MSLGSGVEVEHTQTRTRLRSRNIHILDSEDSTQAIVSLRGTQAPGDVLQLNRGSSNPLYPAGTPSEYHDYPAPAIREVILPNLPPSDSYHGPAGGSALGGAGNQNVFNNHYYAQNPVLPGNFGSSPPVVHNPIEWNDARRCESAAETYARMLLTKRIGYPLWTPEPSNIRPEHEEEGIRIGDVGIVDSDGQFDFFFNVCLPADHPINRRSPPSMVPFTFDPDDPDWVGRRDGVFEPDTTIASESVRERLIHSQTEHEDIHYPCEFQFSCSAPEGAVLALPNDASRTNLRYRQDIQEYARQHVLNWYEHVYRTLRLEVEAGPLYLITGFDKCENWCLGSYVNIPAEVGVSLSFVATNISSGGIVRYSSLSSGAINRRTFSPRNHNSANQCVFIRGYKMMLSKSLTEKITVGPVKISDIIPPGTGDRINGKSSGIPGGLGFGRLLSWLIGGNAPHLSNRHQDAGRLDNDAVRIEAVPGFPESHHPSDIINSYDLSAQMAITHDDDWCSIVEEKDTTFPDGPELVRRILEKYCPVQDAGCVTLVQKDLTHVTSGAGVIKGHLHTTVDAVGKTHRTILIHLELFPHRHARFFLGLALIVLFMVIVILWVQFWKLVVAVVIGACTGILTFSVLKSKRIAKSADGCRKEADETFKTSSHSGSTSLDRELHEKADQGGNTEVLGNDEPYTEATQKGQGLPNIVRTTGQQDLDTRKRALGVEHPETLNAMTVPAPTYQKRGFSDAEMLDQLFLEGKDRTKRGTHIYASDTIFYDSFKSPSFPLPEFEPHDLHAHIPPITPRMTSKGEQLAKMGSTQAFEEFEDYVDDEEVYQHYRFDDTQRIYSQTLAGKEKVSGHEQPSPPLESKTDTTTFERAQIEWRRRQNTQAARKSRERKLQHQLELEGAVESLTVEKETWKERALAYQTLLAEHGQDVPESL